jgi:dTDP-4-dehydrorhamnose 3,5-epimerase
MGETYVAELARGLRWNDPQVAIAWPRSDHFLSDRDRNLPLLAELA